MGEQRQDRCEIPVFDRAPAGPSLPISRLGGGSIGGKAAGLASIAAILESQIEADAFPGVELCVPRLIVIGTDVFDAFMERNDLARVAYGDLPDERIAHAFQAASLPVELVGDLRGLIEKTHLPLAVRSSSLLEDALLRPFAGVYETKMTPNDQHDPSDRFAKLVEAIKFVYASTFFAAARRYIRATDHESADEKMAVVIQEVMGRRHDRRFYPDLSGVGRTHNFYATRGRPEDGVVDLALGLGKTIVDGGLSWTYCPKLPHIPPPFASARDMLKNTQRTFWAVGMGRPPAFDPVRETEYLVEADLAAAEYDDTLRLLASTYLAESDRIWPGVGRDGARVLNFAPLLDRGPIPFNAALMRMMDACRATLGTDVEIEFAMTLPARGEPGDARLGFLQVRPMLVSDERVDVSEDERTGPATLVVSDYVMGNGTRRDLRDVVFVRPATFETKHTREIAREIDDFNTKLLAEERPYLLIGFGRWGSSDPWLGIPVDWGQICGARVIIEASRPDMITEMSQGSHFFHNISSFRVGYFSVGGERGAIDWEWLERQPTVRSSRFVAHVRLDAPLLVKIDGRTGTGVIRREEA